MKDECKILFGNERNLAFLISMSIVMEEIVYLCRDCLESHEVGEGVDCA